MIDLERRLATPCAAPVGCACLLAVAASSLTLEATAHFAALAIKEAAS